MKTPTRKSSPKKVHPQNLLLAGMLLFLAACNFPGATGVQPTISSLPEVAPTSLSEQPAPPPTEAANPGVPLTGQGQTFEVDIVDNAFSPVELSVPAGSTVVWTNNGQRPHTVTADDSSFDSGTLNGGDSFEFTFNEPGTFLYFCAFHGGPGGTGMAAAVTVSAASAPPAAATTAAPTAAPAVASTPQASTATSPSEPSPAVGTTPTAAETASGETPVVTAPAEGAAGPGFTSVGVVNRDTSQAAFTPSVAVGATSLDGQQNLWVTWAEDSPGGVRQIFAAELVDGVFQPRGASLNIHTNVLGEAPTITFAGEDRLVPWVAWVEPSPGFGNVVQVFASRFNTSSGLWQQAGQDRGGSEASLNLHTNRTASRPFIFSGSGDPSQPLVAWVAWEELSSLSNQTQIFVAKAVADDTAIGGFRWEFVGELNEAQEPSINIDRFRQALRPTGVFAETGNAVPWVTWHESGGGRPERVFTARGVADAAAPGGFRWIPVPACTPEGAPDETACALNINPLQDAKDASMAAGSLTPGEATVPWIAWVERGPTGKWQVFVNRLDLTTRNSFLPVGGSLNIDPNHDARTPVITFVDTVPYVAWLEDDGTGRFTLQVRHLGPDLQNLTWIVDTPGGGFPTNPALTLSGLAAAGSPDPGSTGSLFLAWVEGDPLQEAAQLAAGLLAPQ